MVRSLRPVNFARALLDESAHAFGIVGGGAGLALEIAFEVELRCKIVCLGCVERALDQSEPVGRRGGEMHAQLSGLAHQFRRRERISRSGPSFPPSPPASGSASSARPRARAGPTRRGRNQVPPESGTRPSLANACRKVADFAASTMSQASAILQPAPAATPLTAATTGKGSAAQLAHQRIVELLERAAEHDLLARLGEPVVEVLAGAEAAAGAGDQQGAAIPNRASAVVERGAQRAMHILGEGIEPLRPVERDDAKAGAQVNEDGVLVHRASLQRSAPQLVPNPKFARQLQRVRLELRSGH